MSDAPDPTTAFLELLTANERKLALYVHGLVPRDAEAEDILQQTKLIMWKHFGDFQAGTNFIAWGRKIAFHQILSHRRQQKRAHLQLGDEALEARLYRPAVPRSSLQLAPNFAVVHPTGS